MTNELLEILEEIKEIITDKQVNDRLCFRNEVRYRLQALLTMLKINT